MCDDSVSVIKRTMVLRTVLILSTFLFLSSFYGCDGLDPGTLGDAVVSAANQLNHMKVTGAWRRLSSTVSESVALKHALRRLQNVPQRAARLVHTLVDRIRVGGGPVVKTVYGSLRGRYLQARTKEATPFYSFKGIRYAQPPVGALRFRPPAPLEPWRGVRDALEESHVCPHKFLLFDNYKGDEDCLFLNVYTPALPDKLTGYNPRLAVMVWIHGGAFSVGSGNSFLYGPDHLLGANVILVTINYRLGALGFLSLQNDEVAGNMGLKDQVLALKWVKENIEFFGGDPERITIFGESAGGASVNLHMISPLSKGLFSRAIAQSGVALAAWVIAPTPVQRAFQLGRTLGIVTNSTAELLGYLRATPAETLVKATSKMTPLSTEASIHNSLTLPFSPSIELNTEGAFLSEMPLNASRTVHQVPFFTGYNSQEGIVLFRRLQRYPNLLREINDEFVRAVPPDLNTDGSKGFNTKQEAAKRIRSFYFQDRPVDINSIDSLIDLFTDVMFVRPMLQTVDLHVSKSNSPLYLYRFAFDGALGLFKRMLGIQHPGVCHGDEMGYLFYFSRLNYRLDESSPELQVSRKMISMWTNFAKYGDPTPIQETDSNQQIHWEPVSNTTHPQYLEINGDFSMKRYPEADRTRFWDQLYLDFNGRLYN